MNSIVPVNFVLRIFGLTLPSSSSSTSRSSTLAVFLYSALAFAIQALHAPFITFFVDFSSRHLNISWMEFVIAQIIYGMWNSSNEFIFGYLSDVDDDEKVKKNTVIVSSSSSLTNSQECAKRRLNRIKKWGTFWAISFCFLWFPLNTIFQAIPHVILYTFVMIFYGGCFAFVTVQHRSLLVDITDDEHVRERCTMWSSIWGGLGSLSVVAASTAYAKLSGSMREHVSTKAPKSDAFSDPKEDQEAAAAIANAPFDAAFHHWMFVVVGIALVAALTFFVVNEVLTKTWEYVIHQDHQNVNNKNQQLENEKKNTNDDEIPDDVVTTPIIEEEKPNNSNNNSNDSSSSSSLSCWDTLKKVSSIPEMRTIYVVWLLQELSCYVLTSFFVSAVTEIVHYWRTHQDTTTDPAAVTILASIFSILSAETWITLAVGCSFVIPQVVLVGLLPLVRRYGLDVVIASLFKFRAFFGSVTFVLFSWWFSHQHHSSNNEDDDHHHRHSSMTMSHHSQFFVGPLIMIALILSLRLFTECVCRLQPLVLAAMCDDNNNSGTSTNQQQHQQWTASIMGAASLGSKPSQSIAPVLGYAILREISGQGVSQPQSGNNNNAHSALQGVVALLMMKRAIVLYGYLFGVATVPTALGSLWAWTVWPLKKLIGKRKSDSQLV